MCHAYDVLLPCVKFSRSQLICVSGNTHILNYAHSIDQSHSFHHKISLINSHGLPRNVDDAVYTKLLTDAARTMPQKPVTLPCSTTTHCSPPSYTPFPEAQQETTKFVTALQNYTHQSAEQQHSPPLQSYFRETSYAQLYHTALYHSTERYVARGDESAAQQHYIAQQTMDRQHIPYIPNYVTAGHVQTTHTSPGYVHVGGFKKEKVDYSFAHYAPY